MEISFKTKKLQKLCEQANQAEKVLGPKGAKKLRARMADLRDFQSVTDLRAGRPHPLEGNRAGQFALDLEHPRRLVFEADHDPMPTKEDGGIDWSQVTRVRIIWIGDYHG
jgi:toxin HigB-1